MRSTAGYVVCRQVPGIAKGQVFLTLEDEHGLVNMILKPRVYQKYRYVARTEPLIVGPAVLATLLLLIEQYSVPIVLAAFALNLSFAWLVFAQANRIANFLGLGG